LADAPGLVLRYETDGVGLNRENRDRSYPLEEKLMHLFMIAGGLLHATALAVLAFFVWFVATKATGWLRLAGKVLGAWLAFLAVVGLVFVLFAHAGMWRHHMRGGMMNEESVGAPAAPANTTP
jgi:hypothetical protein